MVQVLPTLEGRRPRCPSRGYSGQRGRSSCLGLLLALAGPALSAESVPSSSGVFINGAIDQSVIIWDDGLAHSFDEPDSYAEIIVPQADGWDLNSYVALAIDLENCGSQSINIVGAHWFTFREQAYTGRGDRENFQVGLVDVCDTPYVEMADAIRQTAESLYLFRFNHQ